MRAMALCTFSTVMVLMGSCYAQEQTGLFDAPNYPSAQECAFINRSNAARLQEINQQHSQCLNTKSSSFGEYNQSKPCSKLSCRPIHLKMQWFQEQIQQINSTCNSRLSKNRETQDAHKRMEREIQAEIEKANSDAMKNKLVETNDILDKIKKSYDFADGLRDKPWKIAELAWGEAAGMARSTLASSLSNGRSKTDPDFAMYDLIFNKANEGMGAAINNPVAKLVSEGMLNKLYATHAALYGEMLKTQEQINNLISTNAVPEPPRQMQTVFYDQNLGAKMDSSENDISSSAAKGIDCSIFTNMNSSNALMTRDQAAWEVLNAKCNTKNSDRSGALLQK